MSAGERKPRTRWRWPRIQQARRAHNRGYRARVRHLLRHGRFDDIPQPRASSAKWEVG